MLCKCSGNVLIGYHITFSHFLNKLQLLPLTALLTISSTSSVAISCELGWCGNGGGSRFRTEPFGMVSSVLVSVVSLMPLQDAYKERKNIF